MSQNTTDSGYGTYIHDYRIDTLLEIYRRPDNRPSFTSDIVGLQNIVETRNGEYVRTLVRYAPRQVAVDGQTFDLPAFYFAGFTSSQLRLVDKIMSGINQNVDFALYLAEIYAEQALTNSDPASRGIYITAYPAGGASLGSGNGQIGGSAQPGPLEALDFGATEIDGQLEVIAGDLGYSLDYDLNNMAKVYLARHIIHEIFHYNAAHYFTPTPTSVVEFDSALFGNENSIRNIAYTDPTYGPSDQILQQLRQHLGLSQSTLNEVLSRERTRYGANQWDQHRQVLAEYFETVVLNPTSNVTLTAAQYQRLADIGVLDLKNGAPVSSANPSDYEFSSDIIRIREQAAENGANNGAIRTQLLNGLNGELAVLNDQLADFDVDPFFVTGDSQEDAERGLLRAIEDARRDLEAINNLSLYGQLGSSIGSTLAGFIGGDRLVNQLVISPVLSAIGDNLFEVIANGSVLQELPSGAIRDVLADFDSELLDEIHNAGVGALSSYLVAELINALGITGVVGGVAQSLGTVAVSQIAENLISIAGGSNTSIFANVGNTTALASAAASFLGSRLADEIYSYQTVGGQIGSAIGSAIGAFQAANFLLLAGANPVTIGLAIANVALTKLFGGLIGSLFGGTPRSGADVVWNEQAGTFEVANVYSAKGGSKEIAAGMAATVADYINTVAYSTGGELISPEEVQMGNYGTRNSKVVYREYSTRNKDAITASWSGDDAAEKAIRYGVFNALSDPNFVLAGGDVFAKRAIYRHLDIHGDYSSFTLEDLAADVTIAQDYGAYFNNTTEINLLISQSPESLFAVGWAITLARAAELGINRRAASDWAGGFANLVDRTLGINVARFELSLSQTVDATRQYIVSDEFGNYDGYFSDTIIDSDQTHILGTSGNNTIVLSGDQLIATFGTTNVNLKVDGVTHNGSARTIDVVATIDAGAGNDTVHASDRGDNVFGGSGDDRLYGGRLDDWLLGGDGDDQLRAGALAGGLGGDGNYLDGGDGDDALIGREGSDWLEGGAGADALTGGGGGDILAGGAGDSDNLEGGAGADQYLYRRGDGQDLAEDDPGDGADPDPVADWLARLEAGTAAPDWLAGGVYTDNAAPRGGDDSLVLGEGIGIADIRLIRGGAIPGTTADDLVVQIMTDGVAVGDRITIKDWYNSYKRVEWLAFADGQAIRIGDFQTFTAGTSGDDTIIGTEGRDFAVGGEGDDWLSLLAGDDIGVGGRGRDFVSGDGDHDLLIGGDDDDHVLGGSGNDVLSGDAGADELYGGAGKDILSGGRGDGDLVVGGAGDDIFRYGLGDGRITILDEFAGTWEKMWWDQTGDNEGEYGPGYEPDAYNRIEKDGVIIFDGTNWLERIQFDVDAQILTWLVAAPNGSFGEDATLSLESGDSIEFGLGINIQDVQFAQFGYDLVVAIGQENADTADFLSLSDQIVINDWFRLSNRPIEKFVFAATGIVNTETTSLRGGTDSGEAIWGGSGMDWITANGGDDLVQAGSGNDIANGNAGHDTLNGANHNDVLYGGSGDDVLDGGAGADMLVGGVGSDTASYASSAATAVYLSAPNVNYGLALGDVFSSIENLTGSAHNDYALGGDAGDNVLTGGAGNDNLFGGAGDDIYVWNAWDLGDTIDDRAFAIQEAVGGDGLLKSGYVTEWVSTGVPREGGGGYYWKLEVTGPGGEIVYSHDRFARMGSNPSEPAPSEYVQSGWKNGFSRILNGVSNGQQVVRQQFDNAANGGDDTLELGEGITLSDLSFGFEGADLVIRYQNNQSNYIRIKGQTNVDRRIETLQFNDGLSVALTSIKIATDGNPPNWSSGADLIVGRDLAGATDNLTGGNGNDVLSGMSGSDQLLGGLGDDILEGGAGADTIDGGPNSAQGTSLQAGDTVRYLGSSAVDIDLARTGGQTGGDAAGDVLIGIENVVGSTSGGDQIAANDLANRLFGMGGNDTMQGLGEEDVLVGDAGNDYLYGDSGDDNLSGGEGVDRLWGGSDNDLIDAGEGNDLVHGDDGNDNLVGGGGNDDLRGGNGDDVLVADSGNDVVRGAEGNDQLSGGAGNDQLEGGNHNDTYGFGAESGNDIVVDTQGANTLVFEASVDFDRLWLTRINDGDLLIGIIGSSASVTVRDFFTPGAGQGRVHAILTATHGLYVGHPDVLALIEAMTAIPGQGIPATMPAEIADMLPGYWHAGAKAAPRADAISVQTNEDVPLSIAALGVVDHDNNIVEYSIETAPQLGTITSFDTLTGALTYTADADVNGTDSLTIIARDQDGQAVEIPIAITIAAVNDAPRDIRVINGGTLSVAENAPFSPTGPGTTVGQLTAYDPEGDPITFSLADRANGRFAITSDGVIEVYQYTKLDFEQDARHTIVVQVWDGSSFADQSFTVTVTNINEAPNTPTISSQRKLVSEFSGGTAADRWVTRFTLSDPDGTVPTLRLTDNPGGRFKVAGNEVQFANAFQPDFETLYNAFHAGDNSIVLCDSDGDGLTEAKLTFEVDAYDGALISPSSVSSFVRIEDVNEAPVSLDWSAGAPVAERDRILAGTSLPQINLGTLSVTDPDISGFLSNSYVFSVEDDRFQIVGNTLRLRQGAVLDYEAGSTISVSVTASDRTANPLTITRAISIDIVNVDDILQGDSESDTLVGQQNRDKLYGFDGNDHLDGLDGDDSLYGEHDNDTLVGSGGNDALFGHDDNDALFGGAGDDTLNGQLLNDDLSGGLGVDVLNGGAGADRANYAWLDFGVAATAGVAVDLDTPSANSGAAAGDSFVLIENLLGTNLADTLRGDAAKNVIEGSGGHDILEGRAGNDQLIGDGGNDTLAGGYGLDNLNGGNGNDIINGGADNDTLIGGWGDDQLQALSGDDYLDGGEGNDTLYGGSDNDTYIMTRKSGADIIVNYDPDADDGDIDVLGFQNADGAINDRDLWFEKIGNDLKISIIGTATSAVIQGWYTMEGADATNHKIDFITGEYRYTTMANVDGLVALMATKTKPATNAELNALMDDHVYHSQWANYWNTNEAPALDPVPNASTNEDTSFEVTIRATDDITPSAGIQMSAKVISGSSVIANSGFVFSGVDGQSNRTLTIIPIVNATGTAVIRVQATDAGGVTSERDFTVTVSPAADQPVVAVFASAGGTSGVSGGIPLTVNVTFPDKDGSEIHEVWIAGIPTGVTLSVGARDASSGIWKLTPAQLTNLMVNAPAGWSSDLSLTATARATEGGHTAISASKSTTVVVNAPPTGATLSGSINENAANGTTIGTVIGIDPDAGDILTYELVNDAGNRFSLTTTGILTVANGTELNFETAASHAIKVRIADSFDKITYQWLNVSVNDVNELNDLPSSYSISINENVAVGTTVGTIEATDIDLPSSVNGQQRYYFLYGSTASADSSDGRYTINATTGVITSKVALNYETMANSVAYTVIARDKTGQAGYNQQSTTVTIGVSDLNEQTSLPASYGMAVDEHAAIGTTVGTVTATDPDLPGSLNDEQRYYFLNGSIAATTSSDNRYTIDPLSGVIKTRTALNHETMASPASYVVIARDRQGSSGYTQDSTTVTIAVNDLNEANSLPSNYSMAINENAAVGTSVGSVTATDFDLATTTNAEQRYYFLNGTTASANSSDGRYAISTTTGLITTRVALDYEAGTTATAYTVIARDKAGGSGYNQDSATVAIVIRNLNETPAISNQTFTRSEQPANPMAPLISLIWTDPDGKPVNGHQFTIVGGDNANYWDIDNAGRLSAVKTLDFENSNYKSFTLTVEVADQSGNGLSDEALITINLTNVNEAPNPIAPANMRFSGDVQSGTFLGSFVANDPDVGDQLTYRIKAVNNIDMVPGSTVDSYSIDADGGVYTIGYRGGQWQFSETVTVEVTDAGGLKGWDTFEITYNGSKPFAPVVLDLDDDGLELVSRHTSGVYVDIDRDGILDRTGWVASDDGFLALDRNGDGLVTDSSEISFSEDVPGAVSDLEGLRAYDTNENGFIDAEDETHASFMIWQDLNQDGISSTDELRSLTDAGIAFINLTLNLTGEDPNQSDDNVIYALSEYVRTDGTIGTSGDVFLNYEPSDNAIAPPIILDLDGDGVTTTLLAQSTTRFDMDGDGILDRTGWVGASDGLLALDRNKDGVINDVAEISFVDDLAGAKTDLEGLAAFDSDGDGLLAANDQRFRDFRVWVDANQDGLTDTGELKLLPELGIVSISLEGEATGETSSTGQNVIYNKASFLRGNGTIGQVGDVGLAFIASAGDPIESEPDPLEPEIETGCPPRIGREALIGLEDPRDLFGPVLQHRRDAVISYSGRGRMWSRSLSWLRGSKLIDPADRHELSDPQDVEKFAKCLPMSDETQRANLYVNPELANLQTMRHQLIEALAQHDGRGMGSLGTISRLSVEAESALVAASNR